MIIKGYVIRHEKFRKGIEAVIGKLPNDGMLIEGSIEVKILKDLEVLKIWMKKSILVDESDECDWLQWLGIINGLHSGRMTVVTS